MVEAVLADLEREKVLSRAEVLETHTFRSRHAYPMYTLGYEEEAIASIPLNSKTILEYASSGRVTIHWVYVLVGGLLVISGTVLAPFGITLGVVANLPRVLGGEKP